MKDMNFVVAIVILSVYVENVWSKNQTWDVFIFVQQWPQSFCIKARTQGKKCLIPQKIDYWTIHGLWPSTFRNYTPSHCENIKFDQNKIKDLQFMMNLYWPDYLTNATLWAHEWFTHGTCALEVKSTGSEKLYFQKGLELRKKYDLKSMLDRCNILPTNGRRYRASEIRKCLKKYLGHLPDLHCYKEKRGKYILSEIRLCLTKGFQLEDCKLGQLEQQPFKKGIHLHECGSKHFYYPVINHA